MKYSRVIKGIAGTVLAGVGLYIFFRRSFGSEDAVFETLAQEISHTSVVSVISVVALSVLTMWLRALRLKIMLPDAGGAARHKRGLFSIVIVSFMANNILPARLGEAARVGLLWRRNGYPIAVGVGSILLERILDIVSYLSFLFVPMALSPAISASLHSMHPAAPTIMWLSAAAFAAIVGGLLVYALAPRAFRKTASFLLCRLGTRYRIAASVKKICVEAESSVGWIFSPRKAAGVAALTYAISFCFSLMLLALVYDLSAFGFLDSMFAQSFAAFGSAIPLAPGSVGTLHAALLFGLTATGLEAGKAGAVTVIYHALQYIVVTAGGLLFLAGMNIRLRDIAAEAKS